MKPKKKNSFTSFAVHNCPSLKSLLSNVDPLPSSDKAKEHHITHVSNVHQIAMCLLHLVPTEYTQVLLWGHAKKRLLGIQPATLNMSDVTFDKTQPLSNPKYQKKKMLLWFADKGACDTPVYTHTHTVMQLAVKAFLDSPSPVTYSHSPYVQEGRLKTKRDVNEHEQCTNDVAAQCCRVSMNHA